VQKSGNIESILLSPAKSLQSNKAGFLRYGVAFKQPLQLSPSKIWHWTAQRFNNRSGVHKNGFQWQYGP